MIRYCKRCNREYKKSSHFAKDKKKVWNPSDLCVPCTIETKFGYLK